MNSKSTAEFLRSLANMIDAADGKLSEDLLGEQPISVAPGKSVVKNFSDSELEKIAAEEQTLEENPVYVSPQQQKMEMEKAALGKRSPVINKLVKDSAIGAEPRKPQPKPTAEQIKKQFSNHQGADTKPKCPRLAKMLITGNRRRP